MPLLKDLKNRISSVKSTQKTAKVKHMAAAVKRLLGEGNEKTLLLIAVVCSLFVISAFGDGALANESAIPALSSNNGAPKFDRSYKRSVKKAAPADGAGFCYATALRRAYFDDRLLFAQEAGQPVNRSSAAGFAQIAARSDLAEVQKLSKRGPTHQSVDRARNILASMQKKQCSSAAALAQAEKNDPFREFAGASMSAVAFTQFLDDALALCDKNLAKWFAAPKDSWVCPEIAVSEDAQAYFSLRRRIVQDANIDFENPDRCVQPLVRIEPSVPSACDGEADDFFVAVVQHNIDVEGRAKDIKVNSSSNACINDKIVRNVERWRFAKKFADGVAIERSGVLSLFELSRRKRPQNDKPFDPFQCWSKK